MMNPKTRSNSLVIIAALLTFTAGVSRIMGAPQNFASPPSPGPLQELEQRIDKLTTSVEDLRTEVKRSHEEVRQLRQELNATRAKLNLLPSPNPPRTSPAGGTSASVATENHTTSASGESDVSKELDQLKENQRLLHSELDDQYQTKVESSSKYRVKLSGIALLNVFSNRGTVDNLDLPNFALERGPLDSSGSFGATVRQSQLGLEVFGPTIAGAKSSANVQTDFFGGFPGTADGATTGLIRLRTATMRLDWNQTSIVAGQDTPFFSPVSPTSLASLADPAMSYSGNLWTWTPQVRVEHRVVVTEGSDFVVSAGIMDPLTGEIPSGQYERLPDAGERSRQPAYALRLGWSSSAWKQPFTFGIGSYYSRQDWGFGRNVDAWAATADWQVPLGRKLGLSGEFYRGRALGGLGAAEGRSVMFDGPLDSPATSVAGLNVAGGWAQLKLSPTEKLEFNGAFGEDMPYAQDLNRFTTNSSYFASQVSRNQTGFVNFIYHVSSNVLFSAEYRKLWTFEKYEPKHKADEINLSMGVLF
jgi:outer membrane murein-binding lipoprotein Lpp